MFEEFMIGLTVSRSVIFRIVTSGYYDNKFILIDICWPKIEFHIELMINIFKKCYKGKFKEKYM